MQELRANTQIKVKIGPVVAVGDGFTPVTTLDLSTADEAELFKHDAAAVTDISGATFAAITSADGYYNLTLTTSHTDTEGTLDVIINDDSLCLPVKQQFMVLSEAAWDSKYVAKDDGFMDVNVKTIGRADTQETEASNLEAACAAYSATRGLSGTALPAAAADAAGGLIISDAGGLDADAQLVTKINDILTDTGTTLDGKIDAVDNFIDTEIADIQSRLPAALTADGNMKADALRISGTVQTAADVGELAGNIDTRTGVMADRLFNLLPTDSLAIGSTGNDTTHVHLDGLTYPDDELNDLLLIIFNVTSGRSYARWIEDWVNSTELATVATLPFTPDSNMSFSLLMVRRDTMKLGPVQTGVTIPTVTTLTGHTPQTGDAYAIVNSGTHGNAALKTLIDAIDDYLDTEVAAILAAVDTEVGAIKAVTDAIGSTGTGLTAVPWNASWDAEVQSEVDDALKATLTEGYRSTGAVGSVRDMLYEIIAHMGESSISSTTKTLKKLDGSTTAKTYTLNDASTPTAITETT